MKRMREKTIIVTGVSKSFAMTGWRIGFALGPKEIIQEMAKVHLYSTTCANSIGQYAAVAVAPGNAFSEAGEGYVRMSYACSMEELEKDADRMEAFLEKLEAKNASL